MSSHCPADRRRTLHASTALVAVAVVLALPAAIGLGTLTAGTARAEGGQGGGVPRAAGGADDFAAGGTGANGISPISSSGGGGGGAGATGGAGGTGSDGGPAGGAGGIAPGGTGAAGGDVIAGFQGAGGGGGGAHGAVSATLPVGSVTGGVGGAGGQDIPRGGGGGGGGAGGAGAVITGTGGLGTLGVGVFGGAGGAGGAGLFAGSGGSGGAGLVFNNSASATIGANVAGGNGGAGGLATIPARNGLAGLGGVGIIGSGLSLTISPGVTVSGGLSGNGGQANAINFNGGTNFLTLGAGSVLTGNIGTAGTLSISAPANYVLSSAITGTASVSTNSVGGPLIFAGNNTYTGTTTVTGSLQIGNGGTTGSFGTGNVVINAGSAVGFSRTDNPVIANAMSGGGSVVINNATTFTGANTYSGGTVVNAALTIGGDSGAIGTGSITVLGGNVLTFARTAGTLLVSGNITNGGSVTQSGAGTTVVLSGANTYSGGTTIGPGATLQLGDGGTTGSAGTASIVNLGMLTVNRSNLLTMGQAITGTGSVAMNGSGTLALAGNNTFAGGVMANAGTTTFTSQAAASTGAITLNGGLIRPNFTIEASSLTLNNAIVVTANGGSISGATPGEGSSTIINFILTGALSGPGALTIAGPGTVTLDGTSTRTGMTTINSGASLQIGRGGTSGSLGAGDIVNNGTLSFNRSDAVSFGGAVSGTGAVNILSGILTSTGANTYTGGTTIASGARLNIGDGGTGGSLAGNVVNNGTLAFARSGTLTYAGVVSGPGGLQQNGAGNLILTGANTYTGPTTVNSGTLSVNGSLSSASAVTVMPGATLGGTGSLGSVTVPSGATLAPGNSIGTINVASLTLSPGSTTAIEVQGSTSDRINVAGTANLAGTLRLIPLGGTYNFSTPYTIIQAGSISGGFSTVSTQGSFGAGIDSAVNTSATQVQLVLTPAMLNSNVLPGFVTYNLRATAAALDSANRAGGNLSPFFNVYNQPSSTIGTAVNQLSGEVATTAPAMGFASGEQFLSTVLDPMGYGRESMMGGRLRPAGAGDGADEAPANAKRYAVWGSATGAYNRTTGDTPDGSATRTMRTAGFALGFDHLIGAQSMAGLAVAVGESNASVASGQGTARASFGQIGAYGSTRFGSVTLAGAGAVTFMDTDTRRTLYFLGNDRLNGGATGQVYSLRAEARQDGVTAGPVRFQPVAALQVQVMNNRGYTETSNTTGQTYGMTVAGQSNTSFRSELGAQAQGSAMLGGREVQGFVRASWAHYFTRDAAMGIAFASLPAAGLTVRGARPDADSALISAGIETRIAPNLTLGARIDSEFSGNVQQVAGTARLRYSF